MTYTKPASSFKASHSVKIWGASLAAIAMLAGVQFLPNSAAAREIVIEAPQGAPLSFADLIEEVSPAVVSVTVSADRSTGRDTRDELLERFGLPREFFGPDSDSDEDDDNDTPRRRRPIGQGSGFFISADGHIVTNNHVIDRADEIEVTLKDGSTLKAELIGADRETDLAVLKVSGDEDFKYVKFSSSTDLRVGDWVVALGNPFGLGGTATAGIISALGREGGGSYNDYMQVDAPINRGNSGGPTFNLQGEVIGVNTAIISPTGGSVGIGFAIPSVTASAITEALIANGKVSRGWLGVSIQDVTPEIADAMGLASDAGALVGEVSANSPAKKGGIKRGDIIKKLNGHKIEDARDLTQRVGALLAGSKNEFVVNRDGKRKTIKVTVDERPTNANLIFGGEEENEGDRSAAEGETDKFGLTLRPLKSADRAKLGKTLSSGGMIIEKLDRNSVLRERGISVGDVILEVNGEEIHSVEDFDQTVKEADNDGRSNILLAIISNNRSGFVTVPIDEG